MILPEPHEFQHRSHEHIEGERVELDGIIFHACHFENCMLIFRGRAAFRLMECTMDNISVVAEDEAKHILAAIAISFGEGPVTKMLAQLRDEFRLLGDD